MSSQRSQSTLALIVLYICSCCCIVSLYADEPGVIVPKNWVPSLCLPRCPNTWRCSPYYEGPLVWTVVDGVCKIYKSGCLFGSANCQRQNQCLPKMIQTTQAECQQHCASSCENLPQNPVCAVFPYVTTTGQNNDAQISFLNQCELDKWSCWNSKGYTYVIPGSCQ